jgi:hypothetical protein
MTGWIAGIPTRAKALVLRAKKNNYNSVVVDIKDYSGYVSYKTGNELISKYGAEGQPRISDIDGLLKMLKEEGMYTIARVTVFQDSVLSKGNPDWAIKSKATGKLWRDKKGLAWMDPASKEVWDYNMTIAKDALKRGFDEVNFDYVRFPSDGKLSDMQFPVWDGKSEKRQVMQDFFAYTREAMGSSRISADLFGLVVVREDDMGIGQVLEDALPYFDAVAPMTYPSHYEVGFLGYKNPAAYPYEIMKYSLEKAAQRAGASTSSVAKIRPWFQAFDMGAVYGEKEIAEQGRALEETAAGNELFDGYLLWDPANTYTMLK